MTLLNKILVKGRVRQLSKQVSKDPSARNYVTLAQELARLSDYREVVRVCQEGLEIHQGNAELKRMLGRVAALERDDRMRELQKQLGHSPRPALWREACNLLLESNSHDRAEELGKDWYAKTKDGEALLFMARARCERFYADRRREDGQLAFEYCARAREAMPDDERVLRCHAKLATRVGAAGDARRSLARLLELRPGDPELESRFRALLALGEDTPSVEKALRNVELSGQLVGDEDAAVPLGGAGSPRPLLQELESAEHVHAAFYVRGGTALVQGPRGATAERCARSIREILHATKLVSRRLGLGRALDVQLEGDFGIVHGVPGEPGSAALWSSKFANKSERSLLRELAGSAHTEIDA